MAYAGAIFINAAIYIIAAMGLAVFTGFVSADAIEVKMAGFGLAVAVLLENGGRDGSAAYGGSSAGPIVRRLVEAAVR